MLSILDDHLSIYQVSLPNLQGNGRSQIPNSSSSVLGSDWNMCPILFGSLLLLSAGLCSLAGHAQFRGQPKILLYVVCRF